MAGYYENRVTGPGRRHHRLFCLLDNGTERELAERGFDRPQIAVINEMVKQHMTEFSDGDYRKHVRDLGDRYLGPAIDRRRRRLTRGDISAPPASWRSAMQQGQVFAKGPSNWAYRYRLGSRDSKRTQRSGFPTEEAAEQALDRALERARQEQGLLKHPR